MDGADIFLGLSAGGVLKPEMVATMAPNPIIILALASPYPEILPEDARRCARTASSPPGAGLPEPGQQRAVLPVHLPRRAGRGRDQDQQGDEAGLRARDRAGLARMEASDLGSAYGGEVPTFGREYLIPRRSIRAC